MTEAAVQASGEAAFAPDFVFRSPRRDDAKEATDVLVLFRDVALVIQAKAQSSIERDPTDWARKNLKKAFNQTRGAIRAFRGGRVATVSNSRRGVMHIDINEFPYVYGLAVLHHHSAPYRPSALVPDIASAVFPMHVLSYRDFFNLAYFLDTPWDLIDYLEHRTDVLLPSLNPKVHEKQEAFGRYAAEFEQIHAFRATKRGEQFTVEDGRPLLSTKF